MEPIICKNNVRSVVVKLQEYINGGSIIKCINLVDITEDQVVILVSNQEIEERDAKIWWSGYKSALS